MRHTHWRSRGQTLIEYVLLIALLAIVAIAILTVLGRKARDVYVTVNDAMTTASGAEYAGVPPPPPPPDAPWWQPYLKDRYDGYKAAGDSDEAAFNKAMGDLAGAAGGHGVGPGDMGDLFNEAGGWLGGEIGGGP